MSISFLPAFCILCQYIYFLRWLLTQHDDFQILDEAIVAKWKAETVTAEGRGFTEAMFEWCIAELRWKASIYRDSGLVRVYQADVVKSDVAIPQALNQALSAAVEDLERVPTVSIGSSAIHNSAFALFM